MSNHLKIREYSDDTLRVANYLALFGGQDLHAEYFTQDTQFESNYTRNNLLAVDWEHGVDFDTESPQRDDILGYVDWRTAKVDDRGLWVERVLSRRNEYMQFIEPLIEEGLVGTSSEAVGAKVKRKANGEIQVWPLKRDALTVTPAEPRMISDNAITAIKALSKTFPNLKALLEDGEAIDANANEEEPGPDTENKPNQENEKMTDQLSPELVAAVAKAIQKDEAPEVPEVDSQTKHLSEQIEQITQLLQNSAKAKDVGYVAPDSEDDNPEVKSFGDWLIAVRNGNVNRLRSVYGTKNYREDGEYQKAALAEQTGPTGGYLVPKDFGDLIIGMVEDFSVLRRAGATVVNMVGKSREVPVLDIETAPSAGDTSFAGGVIAYYTSEAGAITESEPRFRMIELTARKLAALSLASSEVREDAAESVDGLLATMFARAFSAKENYNFFRGDGAGKPLGILNSGALASVSRSAASAVALADVAGMYAKMMPESLNAGRCAWFMNNTAFAKVIQLVSNPLSWMENLRVGTPSTLMGFPVYVTGALPELNTAGDILLVDPSYYLAGIRRDLEIGFSEHYKFANDQLAWRATYRHDGQPWIDNSITLENAATTVSPFVALAAG